MYEKIKRMKRNYLILSLFYLLLGCIFVLFPDTSGKVIHYVIACFAFVYGIFHIIFYFLHKIFFRFDLFLGILGVVVGLLLFFFPTIISTTLPILLGIVVFVDGLIKIQLSFELKRIYYSKWWLFLVMACVAIVLGVLMIFYPFEWMMSILVFIGIVLIFNAILDLVHVYLISSKFKRILLDEEL